MIIRLARFEDAEGINDLHIASWQASYRGILPDHVLDGMDREARLTKRKQQLSTPSRVVWWVGEDPDGRIVAWCCTGPVRPDENEDLTEPAHELFAMYLLPDVIGTGLGRRIWEHALERLDRDFADQIILWVLADNARAIRFYERAGFREDPRAKDNEFHGARSIRMVRAIE